MEQSYGYLFRMISHEMKHKADQRLEMYDITNEQGHALGYLYAHQATGQGRGATIMAILQGVVIIPVLFVMNGLFGLTGIVWSLLIAETICALAAMLIVYLLRDRLTVDKAELLEG